MRIQPVEISPIEFERQVKSWLDRTPYLLKDFSSTHHERVRGDSGEYEIDIVARFEVLGGANIVVLVECKHWNSPVKRDNVMLLDAKLRDTGAHKGIIFSTAGFQSGAIQYASARGIATVTVQDGKTTYVTRAYGQNFEPPPWVKLSKYVGWFTTIVKSGNVAYSLIDDEEIDPLVEWLQQEKKA